MPWQNFTSVLDLELQKKNEIFQNMKAIQSPYTSFSHVLLNISKSANGYEKVSTSQDVCRGVVVSVHTSGTANSALFPPQFG